MCVCICMCLNIVQVCYEWVYKVSVSSDFHLNINWNFIHCCFIWIVFSPRRSDFVQPEIPFLIFLLSTGYLGDQSVFCFVYKFVYLVCRPGLALWPRFSSWTHCCVHVHAPRKSYLHKPLATSSSTPLMVSVSWNSTELYGRQLFCIFRVMPTFFNLPNSGAAW